jgi:hypothetical protein
MLINKSFKTDQEVSLVLHKEYSNTFQLEFKTKLVLSKFLTRVGFLDFIHDHEFKIGSVYKFFDIVEDNTLIGNNNLWLYVGDNYWFSLNGLPNERWGLLRPTRGFYTAQTKEKCKSPLSNNYYTITDSLTIEGMLKIEELIEHLRSCGVKILC